MNPSENRFAGPDPYMYMYIDYPAQLWHFPLSQELLEQLLLDSVQAEAPGSMSGTGNMLEEPVVLELLRLMLSMLSSSGSTLGPLSQEEPPG